MTETMTNVAKAIDLGWFLKRVGKRVYRNDNGCGCATCTAIARFGFVIKSMDHARYLALHQDEMGLEYRDKK